MPCRRDLPDARRKPAPTRRPSRGRLVARQTRDTACMIRHLAPGRVKGLTPGRCGTAGRVRRVRPRSRSFTRNAAPSYRPVVCRWGTRRACRPHPQRRSRWPAGVSSYPDDANGPWLAWRHPPNPAGTRPCEQRRGLFSRHPARRPGRVAGICPTPGVNLPRRADHRGAAWRRGRPETRRALASPPAAGAASQVSRCAGTRLA
jgi:hypothetical protein